MNKVKNGGNLKRRICNILLHKNLSSSVVLDELGTYYSKSHFSKTFGSKGLQVLGFQIRDLMVHNIVAFHGKMVSNSYGLSEP